MTASASALTHELRITRVFDAPREMVFEVWTRPEHQMHWLGPKDFTVSSCEIDFRVGGAYRSCIVEPTGKEYWMRGIYREIVVPEKLVFSFSWEEEGERGMVNLITLQFFSEVGEHSNKTRFEFLQTPFQSVSERDGHATGWTQCFDRLAAYLDTGKLAARAGEKI